MSSALDLHSSEDHWRPRLRRLCLLIKLIMYSFIHEEFFSINKQLSLIQRLHLYLNPVLVLCSSHSPSLLALTLSARTSPTVCMPLDFSSAGDAFLPISPTACTLFKAAAPKYSHGRFASQMPPLPPEAPHRRPHGCGCFELRLNL